MQMEVVCHQFVSGSKREKHLRVEGLKDVRVCATGEQVFSSSCDESAALPPPARSHRRR